MICVCVNVLKILDGKPERKSLVGSPRCRGEYQVNLELK